VCILSLFENLNFVVEVYENIHENEEQSNGEDEGRTNVTNSHIVKGLK
jgi:hypothetical protein